MSHGLAPLLEHLGQDLQVDRPDVQDQLTQLLEILETAGYGPPLVLVESAVFIVYSERPQVVAFLQEQRDVIRLLVMLLGQFDQQLVDLLQLDLFLLQIFEGKQTQV